MPIPLFNPWRSDMRMFTGQLVTRMSYSGDINLLQSLWKTITGPKIVAQVKCFAPYPAIGGRDELAKRAQYLTHEWVRQLDDDLNAAGTAKNHRDL